jgi:hypothetical protein
VTERQPIGEILLQRESIDSTQLLQALRDQDERPGDRLVSMLIKRTLIDTDEGALALSEQTGYPAALERHLEARHEDAHAMIPQQLAHRWVVMPIGRSRDGSMVVCARDPTPMLAAALENALAIPIKLAVTPALFLERLVTSVYGPLNDAAVQAPVLFEDTGPVSVMEHELRPARTVSRMMRLRPESAQVPIASALAPLDATLQEIDHAFSIAAVERLVIAFAALRWRSALLVKISDGVALGHRGHGERLGSVEAFMLPIASPSLIQVAHDTRQIASDAPRSELQARLSSLLGDPSVPLAGPVLARNEVEAVLVVGDPLEGSVQDSATDLERLIDALGAAYERFSRGA